jgi:hypothetical protein
MSSSYGCGWRGAFAAHRPTFMHPRIHATISSPHYFTPAPPPGPHPQPSASALLLPLSLHFTGALANHLDPCLHADGSYGAKIVCRTHLAWAKPHVIGSNSSHVNALIMEGKGRWVPQYLWVTVGVARSMHVLDRLGAMLMSATGCTPTGGDALHLGI